MKYLKKFEDVDRIIPYNYTIGDIVVSLSTIEGINKFGDTTILLKRGNKYKVLKIYRELDDKSIENPYMSVDVEDIETSKNTYGWRTSQFELATEFDAKKYNI